MTQSRSRQLRRFNTTLQPVVIEAMKIIRDAYQPDKPLTKAMAQGIMNDAILLWAEMVRQKQVKMKDQQVDPQMSVSEEDQQTTDQQVEGTPDADSDEA